MLQILIDKSGRSFEELCSDFGVPSNSASGGLMEMYYCLMALNEVGLIAVDGIGDDSEAVDDLIRLGVRSHTNGAKIRASDQWGKIQSVLVDRYSHYGWNRVGYSMTVVPSFGPPNALPVYPEVFVLMPFTDELKPVYTNHIVSVANELELSVARADDFFTHTSIISDIWTAICKADVIIADCTGRNPNVFYEIGIAHAIGKALILITQNSEDVPSDMRHIRYIKYDAETGMDTFKATLKNTVCWALGRKA
ncbi:MAG TPA: hypothetical protein VF297_02715 [Pyrinomonadaceae bacterium]